MIKITQTLCIALLIALPWSIYAQTANTNRFMISGEQKIGQNTGGFQGTLSSDGYFGISVKSIGDLDKDGVGDLAAGNPWDDDGGYNCGAIWILFMKKDGTVKRQTKISNLSGNFGMNLTTWNNFGTSLSGIGDLNNDGIQDMAVCAPGGNQNGYLNSGSVWILFLNVDGTVLKSQRISSNTGNFTGLNPAGEPLFGSNVSVVGDINNDQIIDIIVGAKGDDDGGADRGAAYILHLNNNGTVKSHQKISQLSGNFTAPLVDFDFFGYGVAGLGDINKDGIPDVAIGAPAAVGGQGVIYIMLLDKNSQVQSYQKIGTGSGNFSYTLNSMDYMGGSISSIKDIDHDGIDDLLIGVAGDDESAVDAGTMYLVLMNADGTIKGDKKINTLHGNFKAKIYADDKFGRCISAIDDYNNNGLPEIVVGAYGTDEDGHDKGAFWILNLTDTTAFDVALRSNHTTICNNETAAITANVEGGVLPLSYQWSNGETTTHNSLVVKPLATTTYAVTVTDKIGKTNSASITITYESLTAAYTSDIDSINNSITLSPSSDKSNADFFWCINNSTFTKDISPAFKYTPGQTYHICLTAKEPVSGCRTTFCDYVKTTAVQCDANFTYIADTTTGQVAFVNTSSFSMNSFYWQFGDGATSLDKNPTHTYLNDGMYSVVLVAAINSEFCVKSTEKLININSTINDCKADFNFTYDQISKKASFRNSSVAHAASTYVWDFGDADTAQSEHAEHSYEKEGYYKVCLTTQSVFCVNTSCQDIAIEPDTNKCKAAFSWIIDDATNTVTFVDQSMGNPNLWNWNFGDGGQSLDQNPSYTYDKAGVYHVHLNIKNHSTKCIDHFNAIVDVKSNNKKIKGAFSYLTDSSTASKGILPVEFRGAGNAAASEIWWDFGDGSYTNSSYAPSHTFASAGTYNVCMTIIDPILSQSDSYCSDVTVQDITTAFIDKYITKQTNLYVFPMPAKNELFIKTDIAFVTNQKTPDVKLYSAIGLTVNTPPLRKISPSTYRMETNNIPSGVYILKFGTQTRRVVITH